MIQIAIADNRSKSGKTTLALHLGAALAQNGARVLLVDADPNGQLDTLADLAASGTVLDRQGVRMLRSTPLSGLQVVTGMGRWIMQEGRLFPELGQLGELFPTVDYVLFDTGTQHREALDYVMRLSQRVLAPLPVEVDALRCLPETLRLLVAERQSRPALSFAGFVCSHLHEPSTEATTKATVRTTLEVMQHEFPRVCLRTEIPFEPTLSWRLPLPASPAQAAFVELAHEVAGRLGVHHTAQALTSPPPRSWWRRLFGARP